MLAYDLIVFAIGLAFLLKGAGALIENASKIAKQFGISDFVIGVSLIAIGTSLPEFMVASIASLTNNPGIALGDVVGANIANIALNLGISASIASIYIKRRIFDKDCLIVFGSAALLYVLSLDNVISRIDGIILLGIFVYYVLFLFGRIRHLEEVFEFRSYINLFFRRGNGKGKTAKEKISMKNLLLAALSIAALLFGGYLLVSGASGIADELNLSGGIVGLTLVALSTSAPELAVSLQAIKRRMPNILIGNILGSNIANVLLVVGFAALLNPLNVAKSLLDYSMPLMLIIAAVLLMFGYVSLRISRKEGLLLIALYIAAIYFSIAGAIIA
ncbi:MAG: calcium/sodium antiporter [Candidatus Diapherotrites archaeon]|nr:calcium/sodium antiporter [Candidatus Diapherotrites archaeon]